MYKISTSTGKKFDFPESLEDITLEQYIQFLELVETTKSKYLNDIDDAMEELFLAKDSGKQDKIDAAQGNLDDKYNAITNVVMYKHIFPYYARVISFFAPELTEAEILGTDGGEGMNVHQLQVLFGIITDIFNNIVQMTEIDHIMEVDGEFWFLPTQHMKESTVIEFAESSQFEQNMADLVAGQWKALAKVMCVIVRKEKEKYSDKLMKREAMFMKWNLKNCLNVSFFLHRLSEKSIINLQVFTAAQNLMKSKQGLNN